MDISPQDIARQYQKVKRRGWLPVFQREAKRAGTSTAHLLGIGSRETNLENIRGDFRGGIYHGAGVLQVDIGTDPEYVRTWTPDKWEGSVVRGTDILISKIDDTLKTQNKRVAVRGRSFVGKPVEADDLRRIATAAYNCGRWAYYHFSNGNNVDSSTTGGQYSRSVYDRAIGFAKLLEAEGIEPNALKQEIIYQGKYARDRHKQEAGFFYVDRVRMPAAPDASQTESSVQGRSEASAAVPASIPAQTDQPSTPDQGPAPEAVPQTPQNEPPPTVIDTLETYGDKFGKVDAVASKVSGASWLMTVVTKAGGLIVVILAFIRDNWVEVAIGAALIVAALWYFSRAKDRAQERTIRGS